MSYGLPDFEERKSLAEQRSPSTKKRLYTWEEVGTMIYQLGNIMEPLIVMADYIVGVKRGGLVPAVALSNRFKKPLLVIDPFKFKVDDLPHAPLIIVDDVLDTGKVFNTITEKLYMKRTYMFGALSRKPWFEEDNNTYTVHETDAWICFPWEI